MVSEFSHCPILSSKLEKRRAREHKCKMPKPLFCHLPCLGTHASLARLPLARDSKLLKLATLGLAAEQVVGRGTCDDEVLFFLHFFTPVFSWLLSDSTVEKKKNAIPRNTSCASHARKTVQGGTCECLPVGRLLYRRCTRLFYLKQGHCLGAYCGGHATLVRYNRDFVLTAAVISGLDCNLWIGTVKAEFSPVQAKFSVG